MNLIIVESPAKCKTIQKYLGDKFVVKASYGHFRNLADKNMGIDIHNNFQPTYEEDKEKKKYILDLKTAAKAAHTVYLASDDDREGEAIAWHLAEVLKLNVKNTPRIIFHEITKNALTKALENPTRVNMNVVHSQQARQISDKLIGFELSPVLWKHIQKGLSAGRVQSVVTMLVVEKEKEIKDFASEGYYDVTGQFKYNTPNNGFTIDAGYSKDLESYQEASELLKLCQTANFIIDSIDNDIRERKPSPPFITSTLQQEAGTKLGLSAKQAMSVAQKLYEKGKITYMRTDSTILSDHIINEIKNFILEQYGEEYSRVKQYNKKVKGSQDAHECIRPTHIDEIELQGDFTPVEKKLYQMIWRRTVASQMSPQKLEELTIMIKLTDVDAKFAKEYFRGVFQKELFPGYTIVYKYKDVDAETVADDEPDISTDESSYDNIKKNLKESEPVNYIEITAKEKFTQPPGRYTEASLIKKLESNGIGRPSTYANMVTLIQDRGYVVKENKPGIKVNTKILHLKANVNNIKEEIVTTTTKAEKSKLFPTDIGIIVTQFLLREFPEIMNYEFTSSMENKLDTIATGNKIWHTIVREYYDIIHPKVIHLLSQVADNKDNKEINKFKRLLGKDPKNNKNIYVIVSKHGPCLEIGDDPNNRKFASLSLTTPKDFESVTLEDAILSLEFPKNLGKHGNDSIIVKKGPYGFYLELERIGDTANKQRITIPNDIDPTTIDLENAINILQTNKTETGVNRTFKNGTIKIMNGKFGPYIKTPMGNVPLKGYSEEDLDKLTLPLLEEIINKYYTSNPTPGPKGKKKTSYKKTPASNDNNSNDDLPPPKKVKVTPKPKKTTIIKKKTNCVL